MDLGLRYKGINYPILCLGYALYCVIFAKFACASPLFDKHKIGDLLEIATPAYAYGMASMENDWQGIIQLTKVMISGQLLVETIKALKIEKRPNGSDRRSFPSGHTAAAFSAARYVHLRYGLKQAILPYIMAGVTGWQRIATKAHYSHDVLAGVAVAYLANAFFVTPYLPKSMNLDIQGNKIALTYHIAF